MSLLGFRTLSIEIIFFKSHKQRVLFVDYNLPPPSSAPFGISIYLYNSFLTKTDDNYRAMSEEWKETRQDAQHNIKSV